MLTLNFISKVILLRINFYRQFGMELVVNKLNLNQLQMIIAQEAMVDIIIRWQKFILLVELKHFSI